MSRSLFVLFAMALCLNPLACSSDRPEDDPGGAPEAREQHFEMNQAVPLEDGFSVVVDTLKTQETTGALVGDLEVYLSRAPAGSHFVIVEYDVTNEGSEETYNLISAGLRGPDGTVLSPNGSATANYETHEMRPDDHAQELDYNAQSTWAVGETKRKSAVFLVEDAAWEADGWELVLEGDRVVSLH